MLLVATALGAAPLEPMKLLGDVPKRVSAPTAVVKTRADGIDVAQTSCASKASVSELKAHFAQVFEKAGLYLAPEQEGFKFEKGEQVTGLDTDNLLTYTALLQPSGKLTTVVLAMALVGMPKPEATAEAFAPLFPGGSALSTFRLEGVRAMTYSAPGTPAQITGFYADVLGKAGWVKKSDTVWTKGGEQLTLTVSPGTNERYVMLQLQAGEK